MLILSILLFSLLFLLLFWLHSTVGVSPHPHIISCDWLQCLPQIKNFWYFSRHFYRVVCITFTNTCTVLDHACFWERFYSEEISSRDGISFIYFYNIEFTTEFLNLFWHSSDMRQKDCLSSQLNYSYISFQRRGWYDFWVVVTLKVFRMLLCV